MSRQPPPPGLPSRPSARHQENSYRPRPDEHLGQFHRNDLRDHRYDDYSRPRSPPPRYEFRGDRYDSRPQPDDHRFAPRYDDRSPKNAKFGAPAPYRPRDEGFSFRHEAPSSIDFRQADNFRKSPPRERDHNNNRRARGPPGQRGRGGYRGRGGPRLASEREFLKGNRAPTPELMPGMDEDEKNARYKPAEDVSDSDEADMDVSEEEGDDEQPKKKSRLDNKAADGDSVPRWSNPDPYTALPPPDESQRKKKDVVKLIRKARVSAATDNTTKVEADANDFISFDLGGEDSGGESSATEFLRPPVSNDFAGAPTGPRSANTLQNTNVQLQQQTFQGKFETRFPPPASQTTNLSMRPSQGLSSGMKPVTIDLTSSNSPKNLKKRTNPSQNQGPSQIQDRFQTDESLGNRKRTIRDELKAPPRIHGSMKGKKPPSSGRIVEMWRPKPNFNSTPWAEIDHSNSVSMGFWLHKEIMDFYNFVKPREFEDVIRRRLVDDLNQRLRSQFQDAEVRTFGSFPSGLYLPTADMDLVLVSNEFLERGRAIHGKSPSSLVKFGHWLQKENLVLPHTLEVIAKAKVPLVKYVDKVTGLKVDISFENDTGLVANRTFQDWKSQFPVMPVIATILKHYLAMRGLNEPVNGGIGGFSVICLVVSLLQMMPKVQRGEMIPEHHTNEILMEFFDLYGNDFNTVTTAIVLNPPSYVNKTRANVAYKGTAEKFMIIDPNNPNNDIAGGSSNTSTIRDCFADAYDTLQRTMAYFRYNRRQNQSILGSILAGDYSSFQLQRDHLRHVHEHLIGPVRD